MSLHRVASIENWERPGGSSQLQSAPIQPRKMSFSPIDARLAVGALDQEEQDGTQKRPIPVGEQISSLEESSTARRILQVFVACLTCLFAAGLVFGFAALKPVMVAEGVFQEYCDEDDPGDAERTCYEQELRLNLMFAVAAVATNVCALPVGTILDRYGPRISSIIGSALLALGSVFFIAAPHASFDAYTPAYFFLALGGPFVYISAFQLSNCFPRNSGLILALITGAFDTSSAVFLVYRLIYQATNGAFKPSGFFSVYLAVPVLILLSQFTIMPKESYKTVGEMVKDAEPSPIDPVEVNEMEESQQALLDERLQRRREDVLTEFEPLLGKSSDQQQKDEERKHNISGVWGALHGQSALQQIKTPWFVLMTMLVMVQMTRINYFVATVRSQYTAIFHDYDLAVEVNHFFDVALPLGGVISIPFIGLLLDNLSTVATLNVMTVIATVIGILGVLPFAWAAYANVVLFVLYRPLYYTAVSDYAAKVFGFHTFGKVYGLIICVAGLFNFSQSALDALTHQTFHNDPVPVNVILLVAVAVIGTALVAYVWYQSSSLEEEEREELEEEAEASEQHERLIPGATDRPGSNSPAGYGTIAGGN